MIGDTPLAQRFYAGAYRELLAATYDGDHAIDDTDLAFVVGALTFVDRVDEARGLFEAYLVRGGSDPRTIAASTFFLGLAAARAGYFDRAAALLVRDNFRRRHDPDPWVRALVFQGLACQCYFTGRFPGAAAHALRALQAAHEAKFLYAAMLGTDMRGHSLVQIGQLQRGIAMLEQANKQAIRLGLVHNAFAVNTSIATYIAKFDPHASALANVEALLRRRAEDSYSRRALLVEAAVQRALRGRRSDALDALEAADRDALRGDTRRGKLASLIARLWVTRWEHGPEACATLVDAGASLVEPRDIGYRAQLLGFSILVARTRNDLAREDRALAELRSLAKTTQHFLARAALAQYERVDHRRAFDEDAVSPVLRAVVSKDLGALSRIVALGLLGTIPELLGLAPGRRIILIPGEDLLVLEDHGDVVVRQRPPRWCPALLRVLASGDGSKERIVAGLWGLRAYHPELHDPPVRTTIHRLRTFLAPYGSWIEAAEGGYRVTVPIHLVAAADVAPTMVEPTLWEEGLVPSLDSHHVEQPAVTPARVDVTDRVLRRLVELESAGVPELARSLELSASTVLRALRVLVDDRRVERLGFARATRYRARA